MIELGFLKHFFNAIIGTINNPKFLFVLFLTSLSVTALVYFSVIHIPTQIEWVVYVVLVIGVIAPFSAFLYPKVELFFKKRAWKHLTPKEKEFIQHYIEEDTVQRYMLAFNGTYSESGTINPLIEKRILYLASKMSEFRRDNHGMGYQYFSINIHDNAFKYFKKEYERNKST